MADYRIHEHPVLAVEERPEIRFFWQGRPMDGREGETISSALFANGIRTFGHHARDGSPQGIFCANGQCAQCTVIAGGLPVKACMERIQPDLQVEPLEGLPRLPMVETVPAMRAVEVIEVECLVIGGGPAGMAAAIELGREGVRTLVVDDKHRLGGKLVLQTHKFFGSVDACYAGTRGTDIATRLEKDVRSFDSVRVWLNSTAVSVFSDRKVGIMREGRYCLVLPQVLLVTTGAREKSLVFRGNTLPGVYGAGAFQTLVNRDLVRPSERLFIVGGGNVGLIAGYHALQAGITVVGLCEALPECGGYKVHKDKLVRMGVPLYTSHTVLSANGRDEVDSVTIAELDPSWRPIAGTEKTFLCDTVLVAVGLDPVDEFLHKAREFGLPVFAAGDAEEIAEASAAMFTGRIRGVEIARSLGRDVGEVPTQWLQTAQILKSRPGAVVTEDIPEREDGVVPVFHCSQEIPCNPCTSICPQAGIEIEGDDIRGLPAWNDHDRCLACARCVTLCPGLAITLVDYRPDSDLPLVTIPLEFVRDSVEEGSTVTVLDTEGQVLGDVEVVSVRAPKNADHTLLVRVRAPRGIARQIAGIRVQEPSATEWTSAETHDEIRDDDIVCRCERVTAGEIRSRIRRGVRDANHLKAELRLGMGACGGKTCPPLVERLFREEGVPLQEVTGLTRRPLFVEVPLGAFAGVGAREVSMDEAPRRKAGAYEGDL